MNTSIIQNHILIKKKTSIKTISCIRNFTIDCNIFGNYIAKIDIIKNNSMESIINEFVNKLKNDLSKLNLTSLITKLEDVKSDFHIHLFDHSYMLNSNELFTICNKCLGTHCLAGTITNGKIRLEHEYVQFDNTTRIDIEYNKKSEKSRPRTQSLSDIKDISNNSTKYSRQRAHSDLS